ncbi:MAG: carboxypeptidase-like regulatory domain-containing protein [Kofleriaceae bacterium]
MDAEPLGQIQGRVLDREFGIPIANALVHITAPDGTVRTLRSGPTGTYGIIVAPGTYHLLFLYGQKHTFGDVVVVANTIRGLDARIDTLVGEVIVIHEQLTPKRNPVPLNFPASKAPPYSDKALLGDAWTRAWLLLDIDVNGNVTRFKWLKRPGYDLEGIATTEAFKLKFTPALDHAGNQSQLYAIWGFEWVAQSWNSLLGHHAQDHLPTPRETANIPCSGGGPIEFKSKYKGYRDCSLPDLSKASGEVWVTPQ